MQLYKQLTDCRAQTVWGLLFLSISNNMHTIIFVKTGFLRLVYICFNSMSTSEAFISHTGMTNSITWASILHPKTHNTFTVGRLSSQPFRLIQYFTNICLLRYTCISLFVRFTQVLTTPIIFWALA